jgi:predicted branched-subunit amino acid permease
VCRRASAAYVAIAVGVLAVLVVLSLVVWRRRDRRVTPLAGLAVTCVVCGIVLGENRIVGYAFFAGILLAIVDVVRRSRQIRPAE